MKKDIIQIELNKRKPAKTKLGRWFYWKIWFTFWFIWRLNVLSKFYFYLNKLIKYIGTKLLSINISEEIKEMSKNQRIEL
jgi:hypothetical protein